MINIVIVDDTKIFREGVKFILEDDDEIKIINEFSDGARFIETINDIEPDVVLMDIDMPELNGIETTKQALKIKPTLKILTLSMFGEEEYYYKMVHAGVKGFVIKEAPSEELKEAILKVAKGENYFSKELLGKVYFKLGNTEKSKVENIEFSKEDLEAFNYICKGYSDQEIASHLNISETMITERRNDLLQRTKSTDTANLIMYAIKNNIVET